MTVADAFVERAHRRRRDLKLSQAELARRMKARGFPWYPATVQRTETGERPPRLDEAAALADLLGLAAPFSESAKEAEEAARTVIEARVAEITKHADERIAAMAERLAEAEDRATRLGEHLLRIRALAEESR